MYRKMMLLLLAVSCTLLSSIVAYAAGVDGKVTKCEGNNVTLSVAEAPAWLKKGAPVKLKGTSGTVTELSGTSVVVKSSKPAACKAGDEINIVKGVKESQGC